MNHKFPINKLKLKENKQNYKPYKETIGESLDKNFEF